MLILGEGDVEWHNEDQVTMSAPADPNCAEATQPGKTWIQQKAYGMSVAGFFHFRIATEFYKPHRGSKSANGAWWGLHARGATA